MQANEFDHPVVAASYDVLDGPREDLELYVGIVRELGARSVLDVGCGTGTLAIGLAREGCVVTGVDPAGAMLDVARGKPGAEQVSWVHGTAVDVAARARVDGGPAPDGHGDRLPGVPADVAVMTGNVAQVFLTDDDWSTTLRAVRACLVPGGHLVFETRVPERRAWEDWARQGVSTSWVPGVGEVTETFELLDVDLPLVSFRSESRLPDGRVVRAESTLVFRPIDEIRRTLRDAGFRVVDVRDAPDRPGREWVVVAQSSGRET